MHLKKQIYLYHGSYSKIEKIDLLKCLAGKDFGSGFYLTSDYEQAKKFIKTSIAKAVKNKFIQENVNVGYISIFKFEKTFNLKIHKFKKSDKNWLHYVAGNRKNGILEDDIKKLQKFDVIIGKIANDATNRVITAYINDVYGKAGNPEADKTAIRLLLPNRLNDQYCFKTTDAISCLSFEGVKEIKV